MADIVAADARSIQPPSRPPNSKKQSMRIYFLSDYCDISVCWFLFLFKSDIVFVGFSALSVLYLFLILDYFQIDWVNKIIHNLY